MTTSNPSLRLLVTGATGFIGSRLALHTHRLGMDVIATGRAELPVEIERLNELRAANVRVEAGVLQDAALAERVLQGRNCVIHLAAAQHESEKPESYFRAVNVDATRALLERCVAAGVERFVYGSSIGVYGESGSALLDENSPLRPQNAYTRTKVEAEGLVKRYAGRIGTCVIRISETYGPGDQRLLKLFKTIDRGHFVMIGPGTNCRQMMHVNDLIRVLLMAGQHERAVGETFVVAGQEVLTTNQTVKTIAEILERTPPRLRVPLWPFMAAAKVFEATLPRFNIQPPIHERRLDFFRKSFVFSTVKAKHVLGFQPEITFHAGAADTAAWYRSRGLLSAREASEVARTESA
ncbi:MAG TPA: NAD(P)-dependent oxidoreductase [Steroidobacteraceae bacterium]|nr:NAD(P)-dependent oxidoreductase [Steroidobacteraceae bacterium]